MAGSLCLYMMCTKTVIVPGGKSDGSDCRSAFIMISRLEADGTAAQGEVYREPITGGGHYWRAVSFTYNKVSEQETFLLPFKTNVI